MSDITETLVKYLMEDHRQLAAMRHQTPIEDCRTCDDLRSTIAQMEATMQGWEKQTRQREEQDEQIITELTNQCQNLNTEIADLREKNSRQADIILELQKQPSMPDNIIKGITRAFELWDKDPEKSLQALQRVYLHINPTKEEGENE